MTDIFSAKTSGIKKKGEDGEEEEEDAIATATKNFHDIIKKVVIQIYEFNYQLDSA